MSYVIWACGEAVGTALLVDARTSTWCHCCLLQPKQVVAIQQLWRVYVLGFYEILDLRLLFRVSYKGRGENKLLKTSWWFLLHELWSSFAAGCPIAAVENWKETKRVCMLFLRLLYFSAHLRGISLLKCATTYLSQEFHSQLYAIFMITAWSAKVIKTLSFQEMNSLVMRSTAGYVHTSTSTRQVIRSLVWWCRKSCTWATFHFVIMCKSW